MPQAAPRITVEFSVGNTIDDQIEAMLVLAHKINCTVQARLNDVVVVAYPLRVHEDARDHLRKKKALLAKYETDLRLQQKENHS